MLALVRLLFQIYYLFIIIRVIISWVRPEIKDPRIIKVLRFIYDVTEPVLAPVRNLIDRYTSAQFRLDFSPLIVLLLLPIVERIVISILAIFF